MAFESPITCNPLKCLLLAKYNKPHSAINYALKFCSIARGVNFKVTLLMSDFDFEIAKLKIENFIEEENLKSWKLYQNDQMKLCAY